MKLFISYSRQDEKRWALDFWRAVRDDVHDAWIDQTIQVGQDWWKTILDEIEACDCFIYVMTPKSVRSIYCLAELEYALAINKPVLPLKLKDCEQPESLKKRRIQYRIVDDHMTMDRVLLVVERGLNQVQQSVDRAEHKPIAVPRPEVPRLNNKPENAYEVFALAAEALAEGNLAFAEQQYEQVVKADPDGLGETARERLNEIAFNRECATAYAHVKRLLDNPKTLRDARDAWRAFVRKYPDYDPDRIADTLKTEKKLPPKPKSISSKIPDILPPPFAWIEIPAGKVTLEAGGYLKENTEFDVPAFAIAKYPVTNSQFAKYVEAGGEEPLYWDDSEWNQPDHPVVGVSWFQAVAFCQWLREITGEKVTLPTEQQWQRAAQGDDGRVYPWEGDWDCQRCNNSVSPCDSNRTTPVTQYQGKDKGNSPFGVVDMAGNVWEWCLTELETGANTADGTKRRVLRGGSWGFSNSVSFRASNRYGNFPFNWFNNIGFRIALSYT